MNKAEKISHGNLSTWERKREAFFKSNPRCSDCGDKLTNYTRTGKCWRCRVNGNYEDFIGKHPGYQKKYQHERYMNRKNELA